SAPRVRVQVHAVPYYVPLYNPARVFFFFFQAEDGIRDLYVTGVQTCALPISMRTAVSTLFTFCPPGPPARESSSFKSFSGISNRSEERRVGKECRGRWAP